MSQRGARPSRTHVAALGLVLGAGVLLRVAHLDHALLWHDEVYTRIFAAGHDSHEWMPALFTGEVLDVADVQRFQRYDPSRSALDTVLGLARDEPQHPPIYYVLARLWAGWFGDGIGALRSLSALAGLLALPAHFWLCRELYRDVRVAWTGTALLAVSPFFVLYAQEAREYALWGALVTASSAALLGALRRMDAGEPTAALARAWALFALLTALSLYTSFSTAAVVIAQVLFIVLRERGRPTRAALGAAAAMALGGLLFLPWAITLLRHFEAFQASMAWSKTIAIPPTELLQIFAVNASRPVIDLWGDPTGPLAWTGVGLGVLLALVAAGAVVREAPADARLLVPLLAGVPIALLLGPDLLFGGIRSVSARYLLPAWIAVQVALAWLLATRAERGPLGQALLVVVLGVGLASSVHDVRQRTPWTKGISIRLPEVATLVNEAPRPLVVGDRERHNPGNLHALSNLLAPGTAMQLIVDEQGYVLPQGYGSIFLFTPTDQLRRAIEAQAPVRTRLVLDDLHLRLYVVEPIAPDAVRDP